MYYGIIMMHAIIKDTIYKKIIQYLYILTLNKSQMTIFKISILIGKDERDKKGPKHTKNNYFLMFVASLHTPCFVMFFVFLYGPICHGAHKIVVVSLKNAQV